MRILGKGIVSKSILELKQYANSLAYDDRDKNIYDINSNELSIVSPGIPPNNYLVKNTKNPISEYDLLLSPNKYSIWVSGTNGKTSTTSMLGEVLKNNDSAIGGNIGIPLAKMDKAKKIWILETSSFSLHYNKKSKPNIYVLLPIKDDHISWHGSFKAYVKAKLSPVFKMDKNKKNIAFLPTKYKDICKKNNAKVNIIFYENIIDLADRFKINLEKITLQEPFSLNGVLALCVGVFLKNPLDYSCVNNFTQAEHTFERLIDFKNRLWINDSKATNKDATLAGLNGIKDKKIYLILGGDDKGADMNDLFGSLKRYNVELFIIGANTQNLCNLASSNNLTYQNCHTLENAVQTINTKFQKFSNVCLFSPSCASFDQFNSYKHRGEVFKNLIKNLNNV